MREDALLVSLGVADPVLRYIRAWVLQTTRQRRCGRSQRVTNWVATPCTTTFQDENSLKDNSNSSDMSSPHVAIKASLSDDVPISDILKLNIFK